MEQMFKIGDEVLYIGYIWPSMTNKVRGVVMEIDSIGVNVRFESPYDTKLCMKRSLRKCKSMNRNGANS